MDLQEYIADKYDSAGDWFVSYIHEVHNQQRVQDVMAKKEYLNGNHKILRKLSYKYKGKEYSPRKIVLQYAKTLLNFQKAYLLQNNITLTGDERIVKKYQQVNRKGKYNRLNQRILDRVLKYGQVAEYVYMDKDVIKSRLIDPSEGYPVYNHNNNLIAFVHAFMSDGIEYYTVYDDNYVTEYDNKGGELRRKGRYNNLSGLPIVYHNDSELSEIEGRSELDDWISILDNLEELISKYADATDKFLDPIFVNVGQQLKGDGLPTDIVGKGINIDDGGNAFYLQAKLDKDSFESVWKTLLQSLLDISQTPAVSMNKTDISNLSEVSIKLLFQLANIKAAGNELFMREGIEQRFEKIRTLLGYKGVKFSDDAFDSLDFVFKYAMPSNDKEIIEMLRELREIGAISLESILSHSPLTSDVQMELQKIKSEGMNDTVETDVNDKDSTVAND